MESSASAGFLLRGPPVKQINELSAELPGGKTLYCLTKEKRAAYSHFCLYTLPPPVE